MWRAKRNEWKEDFPVFGWNDFKDFREFGMDF
jgi:hypothetical protein